MAVSKAQTKPKPTAAPTAAPTVAPDAVESARHVFALAGEAIAALAGSVGADFTACIDLIAAGTGRVIVSGMGKSAHVGHKIAATLASTGTPAFFVHAAEASHGDLGMIAENDIVLALSNSGETAELADLIAHTRRFGNKLIAMTGKRTSSLGQAADIVLELPPLNEACPLGMAPTTSTTAMIAFGDAIAVALMERRGFSHEDYKVFHPGGKLGRRLLKVGDLMHVGDEMPLIKPDTAMPETILEMTRKTFGIAGVVENGKLIGVVTDGDLRRHMSADLFKSTAAGVMTRNPKTTGANILAAEAVRRMNEWKIACLFVVDEGKPVGIIRLHDILRAGAV
ncbi:MAG: KpsF/GutQ family sugar-phosphate isomerase [Rhodobacteraceae bacterium]|nr:KpsF/GutQ family sugar-phosphate isomerase [Paracoccaceae bacterium]